MKRVAILFALGAMSAVSFGQMSPTLTKRIGKPLPKFSVVSTMGKKVTNASLKGQVVLLDFWATYCGPCKLLSPKMQMLHDQYGKKGLTVIGADTFEQGVKGTAAPYAKRHGYTFMFTEGNDALAKSLGALNLPVFVLVDAKGIVRKAWSGVPEGGPDQLYRSIEAAVKPLLKG